MRLTGRFLLVGALFLVGLAACAEPITVTYLGHSCFTIQAVDGPIVMIDPYASYVPFAGLPQPADIVMMTHGHIDHCPKCYGESDRYTGDPIEVVPWDNASRVREGHWRITDDLSVRFIEASHVTAAGGGQGVVSLFRFEMGGVRFAHLGDLGKLLTAAQAEALGDVDVLFLPVGGAFTLDAAEALTVIAQLSGVKVVFPMHYAVAGITPWADIAPLSDFTRVAGLMHPVIEPASVSVELEPDMLPSETEIWILDYPE